MSELEEKLESVYKLVESTAGALCMILTVHKKIKAHKIKEFRENLIQAVIILDEILAKHNKV